MQDPSGNIKARQNRPFVGVLKIYEEWARRFLRCGGVKSQAEDARGYDGLENFFDVCIFYWVQNHRLYQQVPERAGLSQSLNATFVERLSALRRGNMLLSNKANQKKNISYQFSIPWNKFSSSNKLLNILSEALVTFILWNIVWENSRKESGTASDFPAAARQ